MATSSSRDFDLDVAEIAEEAYELVGLELRTGYDLQRARRSLNLMLKEWGNYGIHLWTVVKDSTALTASQTSLTMNVGELDVVDCVVRYDSRDYPVERITRSDYADIPDKEQTGRPTQLYVDRQIPPVIYMWPVAPDTSYTLVTYRLQAIQDADGPTETIDTPSQFLPAVVAGLAYYLAKKMAPERMADAKEHYDEVFSRALSENTERGSLHIYPSVAYR